MKTDKDNPDLTEYEYIDYVEINNKNKFLYKVLKKLGLIGNEDNWEIQIGGNLGGIRYINKNSKIKF
jgi:hypothetical protein